MRNYARLSTGFMFTSVVGLLISLLAIYPAENCPSCETWGVTLASLFGFMLIAAIISYTHGPIDE